MCVETSATVSCCLFTIAVTRYTVYFTCTVLSQVKAFLPRLEEADRQLQERLQGAETADELDIESVDESEPCIQMVRDSITVGGTSV